MNIECAAKQRNYLFIETHRPRTSTLCWEFIPAVFFKNLFIEHLNMSKLLHKIILILILENKQKDVQQKVSSCRQTEQYKNSFLFILPIVAFQLGHVNKHTSMKWGKWNPIYLLNSETVKPTVISIFHILPYVSIYCIF